MSARGRFPAPARVSLLAAVLAVAAAVGVLSASSATRRLRATGAPSAAAPPTTNILMGGSKYHGVPTKKPAIVLLNLGDQSGRTAGPAGSLSSSRQRR